MTVREALGSALGDFYRQSWRLALLNAALSAVVLVVVAVAVALPPLGVFILVVGPLAAALMHCAVTLAQGDDIRFRDALEGLRLHWRRGLVLGAVGAAVLALGGLAIVFYAGAGGSLGWAFAVLVVYLVAAFVIVQLALWPLAIFERERALSSVARDATLAVLRRPGAFILLAFVLIVVNLLGAAAAVLPLLTLTIAYSFLVAAHFTLPRPTMLEA
jgi:hypothetical protein